MTGNPLRYINAYVLEESDGLTLVDCGWKADDVLAAMHAGLAEGGYALADVKRLVITHHHFDHYGLAGTLRAAGVPALMMHERDWERVSFSSVNHDEFDKLADAWIERNGFPAPEDEGANGYGHRADRAEPTHLLSDGERVGRLQTMWTPGHSPGHLSFFDTRSGRMLTGDHILDPITPHVGFWLPGRGDPLGDYLASLAKSGAVEATGVLPAHGEPFPDLQRRVDQLIEHTHARERQVLDVLTEVKVASAGEIARRLPWTRRNRTFEELQPMHRQFAVSETIAHLEHLRARGIVRIEAESGTGPIAYAYD
jgi:glyoxylase-like metal-dependent hydrolase (beta-lactamase superfamily II)